MHGETVKFVFTCFSSTLIW